MVTDLKNTNTQSDSVSSRSWWWQTCTEFGYYQTGESKNQPFSSMISLQFFVDVCNDVFGVASGTIAAGVAHTNTLYGGLTLASSEVVLPNGSVDPWHALGLTQSSDPNEPAIYIQGTAHCADMYAAAPTDIPALTQARQQTFSYIQTWLKT
eukprot:TRINITY_DN328_c0_g1_i7.p1 TRINITY_DN328_c0_g1~~TRINITY_DN328_c0_g1_i7.p1  ORF type:complete len:152 (+),score=28.17 TRINITY_DN328_c0_g1_i7:65-520(+)